MVSSVSSINQYTPNLRDLEIIRRMQSLGLSPSGNKNYDMQRLQIAEIQKKQSTLATNSEPALNRIEGTDKDFSTTFSVVQNTQPTKQMGNNQNGLVHFSNSRQDVQLFDSHQMTGASQLAELNKLKLGLIA